MCVREREEEEEAAEEDFMFKYFKFVSKVHFKGPVEDHYSDSVVDKSMASSLSGHMFETGSLGWLD